MPLTNYANGVSSFGMPVLPSYSGYMTTGSIFFVNSTTGEDAPSNGTDPDNPFASIDYAVGRCAANQGDLIVVLPGHAETVSAAGGLDLDVAGIAIVGLGYGSLRPTITLGTNTGADIDVDAANIRLANVRIVTGIAALVNMLDVNAANFALEDSEVVVGTGSFTCLDAIVTGATTASNGMRISRNLFTANDVDGPDTAIDIVGTPEGVVIEDNVFFGAYDEATIHNATGNVATNMILRRNMIENDDASALAVDLDSACTGVAHDNRYVTPNIDPDLAAAVDMGSLRSLENYAVDAADVSGALHPAET